jgi:beta-glucanase (GH16 family)
MFMRYIYGLWNDKKDHSVPIENFQQTYSAFNQFYTYGFLWTKDRMSWYIDDQLIHTKTKGVEVPSADWPDKPMCLVINNGLMRVVSSENTTFPNALILDYLKIYEDNN